MDSNTAMQFSTPMPELSRQSELVHSLLVERSSAFAALKTVREKGWSNPRGDEYFYKQRQSADTANYEQRCKFYKMMRGIGHEMNERTRGLEIDGLNPQILDVCAAPGGFARALLDINPSASLCGITLPEERGGHELLLPNDVRTDIRFVDLTLLGLEFGLHEKDLTPDMSQERVFVDKQFDLVVCDGQLLRTHEKYRDAKMEKYAAERLMYSQLAFSMQRLRNNGTMIMLLHQVEEWKTLQLLETFSQIATVRLFKPTKAHAARSSFYLVATNIQSKSPTAMLAIENWKHLWRRTTLSSGNFDQGYQYLHENSDENVKEVFDRFAEQLIHLAEPLWDQQRYAIERYKWYKEAQDHGQDIGFGVNALNIANVAPSL